MFAEPARSGVPRGAVEARADDELDRCCEQDLECGRQRELDADELQHHVQHHRRGQQHRDRQDVAFAAQLVLFALAVGRVRLGLLLGRRRDVRFVASARHGLAEFVGGDGARDRSDVSALQRDVDIGLQYTRNCAQRFLDASGAGAAGHATNAE